jgi:hypothetical protein
MGESKSEYKLSMWLYMGVMGHLTCTRIQASDCIFQNNFPVIELCTTLVHTDPEEAEDESMERDLNVLESFEGSGGIRTSAKLHGLNADGFERERDPAEDATTREGFLILVRKAKRLKPEGMFHSSL